MPPLSWFRKGRVIHVHDRMQTGYSYTLSRDYGDMTDHPDFLPELTPDEMLRLGVFEGKYLNDCTNEFPSAWFQHAKRSPTHPDPSLNLFGIRSRQPLGTWRRNHWIYGDDVRGWFQWYCRVYIGRRDDAVDRKQIARWKSFRRHQGQIRKNCRPGDLHCRPRQRQALLQWAYNPFI